MLEKKSEATYRIGEVADIFHVKTSVLRFWESEFPQLTPLRTQKGQRLYTAEHVNLLRRIRHLLYEQGMTIEGARRVLEQPRVEEGQPDGGDAAPDADFLHMLKKELLALRQLLSER